VRELINSVIAERKLSYEDDAAHCKDVCVILGKPTESDKGDYFCQVQILGLGDEKLRPIYGIDSMQALQLALRFISSQLDDHRKNLRWVENEDSGF
jgi:hypothetical protein